MGRYIEKKEVKKALEEAKKLEQTQLPSKEEITGTYKEGMGYAEKLMKLLRDSWFVKDVHKKTAKKSSKKPKRKRLSSKSL